MRKIAIGDIYEELEGKKRFLKVVQIIDKRNIICLVGRRGRKKTIWIPRRTVLLDTVLQGDGFRLVDEGGEA